ncbi:hypothetical protein BpHYR1_025403 [Brachionus plicatilis]|uniref:Uncharacterized protein n=1 Tax=Brachionus plicatilis TaxID=10195 RepID=A0A3M7Q949_BRAPC|nr:hypothetical protein BpHYR1_025403 [Brachionus plicatilis]
MRMQTMWPHKIGSETQMNKKMRIRWLIFKIYYENLFYLSFSHSSQIQIRQKQKDVEVDFWQFFESEEDF